MQLICADYYKTIHKYSSIQEKWMIISLIITIDSNVLCDFTWIIITKRPSFLTYHLVFTSKDSDR